MKEAKQTNKSTILVSLDGLLDSSKSPNVLTVDNLQGLQVRLIGIIYESRTER